MRLNNRIVKNATWIIGCKVAQAVLALIVSMLSARYLGPSKYGLLNYAASLVAFVVPIMHLGLDATLVQELINAPNKEGEVLGTALTMCVVSGVACILGITTFVCFVHSSEVETIIVVALYSTILLFQAIEMIQYWFQAKLLSKYTSIVMLVAYVTTSVYKLLLLVLGSSVYWFAIAQSFDYCIIAVALCLIYKRLGSGKLSFSLKTAKQMFSKSRYYIVSSLMVTIFAQTDRIMLKMMIDETAVGYYSAAVSCAGMTGFVFIAIISSARPVILEKKQQDQEAFENTLKILYAIIIYLALAQSAVLTVFSEFVIAVLYGSAYSATSPILKIVVWFTTFSYIGSVRNIWILAEGKQRYLWIINLSGALANVILNLLLIPTFGINGAAIASLVTQFFTNVVIGFVIKPIRANNWIMIESLRIKSLLCALKYR